MIYTDDRLHRTHQLLIGPSCKIHRAEESIRFLTPCKNYNLQPNFTRISNKLLQLTNWSPTTLRQKRAEKIDNAIVEQYQRIEHNDHKIKNIFKLHNISS